MHNNFTFQESSPVLNRYDLSNKIINMLTTNKATMPFLFLISSFLINFDKQTTGFSGSFFIFEITNSLKIPHIKNKFSNVN